MSSPVSLEKDSSPRLVEATDRHTKKVKVREKHDDTIASKDDKRDMESMEVNMEDVSTDEGLTEEISFKDKLVGSKGRSTMQKSPFNSDIDLLD